MNLPRLINTRAIQRVNLVSIYQQQKKIKFENAIYNSINIKDLTLNLTKYEWEL